MSDAEDQEIDFSKVDWDDEKRKVSIKSGKAKKVDVVGDLLSSIKSTKNIDGVKKQLKIDALKDEKEQNKEPKPETRRKKKPVSQTLRAPLHRQATNRIASKVAYGQTKKDLKIWNDVVFENRVAEQLVYPLNPEDAPPLKMEKAADKAAAFTPRTEFEKQMAEVLGTSKNNLKNDEMYTEAELEIIKAMSLREAKAKTKQLQDVRRLMSYREAKYHRQAKIKSKQYHKIKKRQKRREVIKEFEELLAKDPEAAKEKLLELQTDRAYERATLRHRGQNKWSKELRQYASRNPEIQEMMADHLRYGRELKAKLGKHVEGGFSSSSEDEEDDPRDKLTAEEIMNLAADEAAEEIEKEPAKIETAEDNPWLKVAAKRVKQKKLAVQNALRVPTTQDSENVQESAAQAQSAAEDLNEEKNATVEAEDNLEQTKDNAEEALPVSVSKSSKKKKKKAAAKAAKQLEINVQKVAAVPTNENTDEKKKETDQGENASKEKPIAHQEALKKTVAGKTQNAVKQKEVVGQEALPVSTNQTPAEKKNTTAQSQSASKQKKNATQEAIRGPAIQVPSKKQGGTVKAQTAAKQNKLPIQDSNPESDVIDLKNFLMTTTASATELPEAMDAALEEAENQDELNDNILAEAFAEDDVVEDFEKKKRRIENEENPEEEEIDIRKMGWGSWTGPGCEPSKPKKKKPKVQPKRQDGRVAHVIVRESLEDPLEKHRPKSVPFPFARAKDYEAVLRQPIGRDWNLATQTAALTRPEVVAPAGRIMRPIGRALATKRKAHEVSSDSEPDN